MHTALIANAIIHELSLAAAYGGTLFGKKALEPAAIQGASSPRDRGKVLDIGWNTFNEKINVPAHVAFTVTHLIGRSAAKRFLANDKRTMRLIRVKDALIAGALVTGVANTVAGRMMKRDFPDGVPIPAEGHLSPEKVEKVARYASFFKVVGGTNLALLKASIAIGPVIGVSMVHNLVHSSHRGLLSRLLKR